MNIEISDKILEIAINKLTVEIFYDILREDDNIKTIISNEVTQKLIYILEKFDYDSLIKNKVDTILDEKAESYLLQKGKDAIKKAFRKLCSNQQTELPIFET